MIRKLHGSTGNRPHAPFAMAACFVLALIPAHGAMAVVVPAALFSDNAVLQADREVPVWGWDNPGQEVVVTLGSATAKGQAGPDGRWDARLPAMPANDVPGELKITGSSTATAANVLVGEVWVGSGQSNMAWTLNADYSKQQKTDPEGVKKARESWNYPKLRMFTVEENMAAPEHIRDVKGKWTVCTPNTAGVWSAAGFYFAQALQQDLGGIPVGVITTAVGGTKIFMWLDSKSYLDAHPDIAAKSLKERTESAPKVEEYYAMPANQRTQLKRPAPVWPGAFYDAMVAPLMPYAVRGIAWYQGESDSYLKQPGDYAKSLALLVKTWRAGWRQDDLPFIVFQLANLDTAGKSYGGPNTKAVQEDPVEYDAQFPPIREVQRLTVAAGQHSGLVVVIDSPDPNGVHPSGKGPFGKRWELQALKLAYGKKDLVASGPMFAGCEFTGGKAVVRFTDMGRGLATRDGGPAGGFAIAGEDGKFFWAKAVIGGNTVELSASEVEKPARVRYSWAENPIGNLINREGLPASPFATDAIWEK